MCNAVINREGEWTMNAPTTQEHGTTEAPGTTQKPKPQKSPHTAARKPRVAPSKAKSGQKTNPAKKGDKGRGKAAGARQRSKTAKVLDLLKRSGGATLKELLKATGWQPHSVRGFLSGALHKKMG